MSKPHEQERLVQNLITQGLTALQCLEALRRLASNQEVCAVALENLNNYVLENHQQLYMQRFVPALEHHLRNHTLIGDVWVMQES